VKLTPLVMLSLWGRAGEGKTAIADFIVNRDLP
jgi:replication-associated recombination protein RarA